MTLLMCDVDSTLLDFEKIVREIAPEFGFDWPSCNWWTSPNEFGKSAEDFYAIFRVCHSAEYFLPAEPYEYAVDVLNSLAIDNPELTIFYVSHRSEDDNHVLHDWLTKWKFPFAEYCISTFDKVEWIKHNNPYIVIDDRVRTMVAARDLGVKSVLSLTHPWNCNLKHDEVPGIKVVDSWRELGKEIEDFIMGLERG